VGHRFNLSKTNIDAVFRRQTLIDKRLKLMKECGPGLGGLQRKEKRMLAG